MGAASIRCQRMPASGVTRLAVENPNAELLMIKEGTIVLVQNKCKSNRHYARDFQ
jgi:hypothetical protein